MKALLIGFNLINNVQRRIDDLVGEQELSSLNTKKIRKLWGRGGEENRHQMSIKPVPLN
jgi:hypothetical protein